MRILTIITICLALNVSADTFTAKQIENAKKIKTSATNTLGLPAGVVMIKQ